MTYRSEPGVRERGYAREKRQQTSSSLRKLVCNPSDASPSEKEQILLSSYVYLVRRSCSGLREL